MTDLDQGQDPMFGPDVDTTTTRTITTPEVTDPTQGRDRARPARRRWLIAGSATALVAVLSAVALMTLTGAAPPATVMGYVPPNSVMYGEVRLDLPGDQRQQVGAFLSRFPGFADQAALETKLDEVLDRIVGEASANEQTFTRDIKPWFDGQVAFAMGPLPEASTSDDPAAMAAASRGLVLISIKDPALARAWFDAAIAKAGATGTKESYGGTDLTVFSANGGSGVQAAFAIVGGKVAVAGDLASVKAAVDTKGASGLAQAPGFAAATAASSTDHLGFVYVGLRSIIDRTAQMAGSAGGAASAMPVTQAMLALVPEWTAFRLRVEADAMVMDAAAPDVPAAPGPQTNHANGVAGYAPPSTILLAAGNDAGKTLLQTVALLRSEPSLAEGIQSVEQAAGILGGLDGLLSWMGDTGLVLAAAGESVEGGLVSIPADPARARQLLTTIRTFASLGGAQQGITVRDEEYAGTTITTIDLGPAQNLLGMAAALAGGALPGGLPAEALPAGDVEIAYAATEGVVVIGSGPAFVKHILDAGAGASLADDARFAGLVKRVGAEHTGLSFIDLAAIRSMAEGFLALAPAEQRSEYETSIKPFLVPFDALVGAAVSGPIDQQHLIVTVK